MLSGASEAERANWRSQIATLTPRQREILELVTVGLQDGQIAARLDLSEATVKTHLQHVYRKLEVTNRVEATSRYLRAGPPAESSATG